MSFELTVTFGLATQNSYFFKTSRDAPETCYFIIISTSRLMSIAILTINSRSQKHQTISPIEIPHLKIFNGQFPLLTPLQRVGC